MDILIGQFQLTRTQQDNFITLNVSPFKGVFYDGTNVYGVSDTQPTQGEIDTLSSAITALPTTDSAQVSEAKFNVDLMTTRIAEEIDDARELALLPYLGGIQSAAKAKNWTKLKNLINGLETATIATSDEATAIRDVIAEQGIILGNY